MSKITCRPVVKGHKVYFKGLLWGR